MTTPATSTQVGGDHYKGMPIQPAEFIHRNGLGFIEGSIIKYVCRHRRKNGRQDLEKARHFLEMLIEYEYAQPASDSPAVPEFIAEMDSAQLNRFVQTFNDTEVKP